jgi:hypothetical protein
LASVGSWPKAVVKFFKPSGSSWPILALKIVYWNDCFGALAATGAVD